MSRPNAIFIENGYATIARPGRKLIETTGLNYARYVRVDDGRQYPQLCYGAETLGNTLIYATDEKLARDCRARLYKTRKGFNAAAARMAPEDDEPILSIETDPSYGAAL